jgi:hypothetical protein
MRGENGFPSKEMEGRLLDRRNDKKRKIHTPLLVPPLELGGNILFFIIFYRL